MIGLDTIVLKELSFLTKLWFSGLAHCSSTYGSHNNTTILSITRTFKSFSAIQIDQTLQGIASRKDCEQQGDRYLSRLLPVDVSKITVHGVFGAAARV